MPVTASPTAIPSISAAVPERLSTDLQAWHHHWQRRELKAAQVVGCCMLHHWEPAGGHAWGSEMRRHGMAKLVRRTILSDAATLSLQHFQRCTFSTSLLTTFVTWDMAHKLPAPHATHEQERPSLS